MHKSLKALALASVAMIGLAACNGARDTASQMVNTRKDGRGFLTKKYGGRDYGVFVPVSYNPANKYPVIVFLHGVGEGGSDINKPLQVGLAPFVADQVKKNGDFDFIVVFPQSPDGYWDKESNVSDVVGVVSEVKRSYSVDEERVALTGLSTGGYGTWWIGARNPHLFSALVPMGSSAACTDQGSTLAKMNVWAIENAADPFGGFGANGRSVDSVVAAGGHPKHTTYPTFGHNCWETAYGDGELFSWLRSTRRSRAGVPTSLDKPVSSKATSDATPARGSTGGPIQLTPVSSGQVIQRAQSSAVPSSASRDVQANGRAVVPTPY